MGEFLICGLCGKQFQSAGHYSSPHEEGYCSYQCWGQDELIGQAARATELFSEDELEANARMIDAQY